MKPFNHKYITRINFILIGVCLFTGISCKKFVDIAPPPNQAQTNEIFNSNQSALSAMVGLYSQMRAASLSIMNGGATLGPSLSSDDLYITASNANYDPFYANALLPSGSVLKTQLWQPAYRHIYQANAILEGINASTVLADSVKNQLRGEALVVRAFCYFYLVNLFGEVPFAITTDYRDNALMPRTSVSEIIQKLITDLIEAQNILKITYPSSNRTRPNKWTATALLARIYLYIEDWPKAETQATAIIGSSNYSLSSLGTVFTSLTSNETIWQLVSDINNTAEGATFIPSSGTVKPTYALTSYLINAFEAGDGRKSGWVGKNTISGVDYYYPNKYKQKAATPISEYYVVVRLAEMYLIRAEARAKQNNLSGAIQDINSIRIRALLPALSSSLDQGQVLSAVEQERRVELFTEWGNRWFDLKRTGRANAILSSIKAPNWQATDTLYPIPLDEISRNPFLSQNPGY